jgi:hypothetical protein
MPRPVAAPKGQSLRIENVALWPIMLSVSPECRFKLRFIAER